MVAGGLATFLMLAATAALALALAAGIAVFMLECVYAARLRERRPAPPRLGPCPWQTADEVDQARLDALRRAGL